MKTITDRAAVQRLLREKDVARCFDTAGLPFVIQRYERGELLARAGERLDWLLFLAEGMVQIYGILSDGRKISLTLTQEPVLLGDIEFCQGTEAPFYVEAMTEVTCLALPMETHRKILRCDVTFLHTLLHSLAGKISAYTKDDVETPTVEEKVLFYLRHGYENHELNGIEAATIQLRCSRRQLQRVLRDLCAAGTVVRTGKGRYRLSAPPDASRGR